MQSRITGSTSCGTVGFVEIALAQDEALLNDRIAEYNRLYSQHDKIEDRLEAEVPTPRWA